MVIELLIKNRRYWFVSLMLGSMTALTFIVAAIFTAVPHGKKWLFAVILTMAAAYFCFLLLKQLWHLLIMAAVFFIPIRLDFYLFLEPTYTIQLHGLPVTAFDILLLILLSFWAYRLVTGKDTFNFYPSISVPAILYIFFTGVSTLWAADRFYSFLVFILILKSYLVFLFFANKIKTREEITYVILALILGVALQSFVGAIQYTTGQLVGVFGEPKTALLGSKAGGEVLSRVGGTIGHPNALAKYLNFCLPVFLCVAFIRRFHPLIRFLACFTFFIGGFTELLTFSRGGWVALGTTLVFTVYEIYRYYVGGPIKSMVLVLLSLLFLCGTVLIGFEDVRERLFGDDYGVAMSRVPMAMVALEIIKDNPVTGVGLNNYTSVMHSYDRTRVAQTYKFPHPVHNSYLLIAAESGIPALITFLWMIFAAFSWVLPSLKLHNNQFYLLQVGWISGVMTWLVAGLFDRDFAGTNVMFWFSIAMVVVSYQILQSENVEAAINVR